MTLRPCLDCGQPAPGTRCAPCRADRLAHVDAQRGTASQRGYDARWRRLSTRARRLQPFCEDCGAVDNLTADHLRWPARTLADVAAVCAACNNRRGPARGPRGNTRHEKPLRPAPQAIFGSHSDPGDDAA